MRPVRATTEAAVVTMHADQLMVSVHTVRRLVQQQFPQWGHLPIEQVVPAGTVNAVFRLGDRLAARFPLQAGDPAATRRWLEAEAGAARELRGRTSVPTPAPVALGEPGLGYPLPWSVQTWVPGTVAADADPAASVPFGLDLATFVAELRGIGTGGRTFAGRPGRGGDLRSHDTWMQECLRRSAGLLDVPLLRRTWQQLRQLPRGSAPDVMSHGDLVPGNVLVSAGRLAGVLDVGGLGPADPAVDLVGAWHLLGEEPRRAFRDRLGCDDLTWARGMAWAFEQAMGLAWYYAESHPGMSRTGRRTLDRLLAATA